LEEAMPASLLEETLEAWRYAREGVIDEVRNIPAEHFDFRPTPEMRSVREQVVHVLEVAMMMVGELTRDDTDFRRAPWPKLLAMYAQRAYDATSRDELLGLLASQLAEGERAFRERGELTLYQFLTRFDGKRGTKFTWLQHGIAQEEYHRAQLTVYARLLGLVPALTKRIKGG
jgi:uncharacterized damage-inducible protein DinB